MPRESITFNGREVTNPLAIAGIKLFLGGMMLLVGGGLMLVRHVTLADIRAARDWEARPCTIQQAEFMRDDEGERYLEIEYEYQFAGATYQGDRLDLMPGRGGDDGRWEEELLAANPAGSNGTCYVDPHDPAVSVLDREHGVAGTSNLRLLAFPFLFAGAAMCFSVVVSRPSRKTISAVHLRKGSVAAELSSPPRRLGLARTVAFAVASGRTAQVAWVFFVGFAYVFTVLEGPAAVRDVWPGARERAQGRITRVEPLQQFELRRQVAEYEFRFEAAGRTWTSSSHALAGLYQVDDSVDVVFDSSQPEAAYIAGTRRAVAPLWVVAIPGGVVLLLGLGIVTGYVFNLRTLRLLRGGVAVEARRLNAPHQVVASRRSETVKDRSGHVFDVDGETWAVDSRSRTDAEAETVVVLFDPLRPQRNLGLSQREQSLLLGNRNPWVDVVASLLVPAVCVAALTWLWGK